MKRLPLIVFVVGLVSGCASSGGVSTMDTHRDVPKTGKIDKFFFVLVGNNVKGGCTVDVQPKTSGTSDYVKVKRNWRVAWFILNTCERAKGTTPTIEFKVKGSESRKEPINFEYRSPHVLIGKVKNDPHCRDANSAVPCTTYKYTVFVGKDYEDPEIEIIEF